MPRDNRMSRSVRGVRGGRGGPMSGSGGVEPSAAGVPDDAGEHDGESSAAPDRRGPARATRSSTQMETRRTSFSITLDSPSGSNAEKGAAEALVDLCKVVGPTAAAATASTPPLLLLLLTRVGHAVFPREWGLRAKYQLVVVYQTPVNTLRYSWAAGVRHCGLRVVQGGVREDVLRQTSTTSQSMSIPPQVRPAASVKPPPQQARGPRRRVEATAPERAQRARARTRDQRGTPEARDIQVEFPQRVEFLGTKKMWTESLAARRELVLEEVAVAANATTGTRCVWHA